VNRANQGKHWQIQISTSATKEEPVDAHKPVEATAIKPNEAANISAIGSIHSSGLREARSFVRARPWMAIKTAIPAAIPAGEVQTRAPCASCRSGSFASSIYTGIKQGARAELKRSPLTPLLSTAWRPPGACLRSRARGPIGAEAADVRAPLLCISLLHQKKSPYLLALFLAFAIWLDRATIQFRFFQPSSFNTALLQLVLRPHFLVHFV
jgi:hypothetical protein